MGLRSQKRLILQNAQIKFIYSEKASRFFEISTIDFSYVVTVKSMVEISQNFEAFSQNMNFDKTLNCILNTLHMAHVYRINHNSFRYCKSHPLKLVFETKCTRIQGLNYLFSCNIQIRVSTSVFNKSI